jgi:hypothetical protein
MGSLRSDAEFDVDSKGAIGHLAGTSGRAKRAVRGR